MSWGGKREGAGSKPKHPEGPGEHVTFRASPPNTRYLKKLPKGKKSEEINKALDKHR